MQQVCRHASILYAHSLNFGTAVIKQDMQYRHKVCMPSATVCLSISFTASNLQLINESIKCEPTVHSSDIRPAQLAFSSYRSKVSGDRMTLTACFQSNQSFTCLCKVYVSKLQGYSFVFQFSFQYSMLGSLQYPQSYRYQWLIDCHMIMAT